MHFFQLYFIFFCIIIIFLNLDIKSFKDWHTIHFAKPNLLFPTFTLKWCFFLNLFIKIWKIPPMVNLLLFIEMGLIKWEKKTFWIKNDNTWNQQLNKDTCISFDKQAHWHKINILHICSLYHISSLHFQRPFHILNNKWCTSCLPFLILFIWFDVVSTLKSIKEWTFNSTCLIGVCSLCKPLLW
jgi:hypothetical protein